MNNIIEERKKNQDIILWENTRTEEKERLKLTNCRHQRMRKDLYRCEMFVIIIIFDYLNACLCFLMNKKEEKTSEN